VSIHYELPEPSSSWVESLTIEFTRNGLDESSPGEPDSARAGGRWRRRRGRLHVLVQVSDHTRADERPLGEPVLRTSQPGHGPRIRYRPAPPFQESSDEVLRLDHVLGFGPGDPDEWARRAAEVQRGTALA